MRSSLLACLLLFATLAMAQDGTRQERKARALLAKGKPYPAIRIASGMLQKGTHPEFYILRATGYNSIAEFEKAETDARKAVRLIPDSISGLFQLALAEQGLGRLDSAAAHFTEVIQRMPGVEAYYRRAMVEQLQGRLSEAVADIDRALVLENPATSAKLHRIKGELAAMAGDTTMADRELDKAVQLAPDDPVNYNSRGYYGHAFRGDHAGAILDYDRAIKLNPNYSYAFNNRGWSYYRSGHTDKGLRDIQRARKKKVHNPFVYRNLGVIALETGDTAKACVLFRQALDRGFTALYGTEVEDLMAALCKETVKGKPVVPVQAPQGIIDRKTNQPARRNNAP